MSDFQGNNVDGAGRDRTDRVTADETGTLISADKVVGTAVYDGAGRKLGAVHGLMLNKRAGKVAFAVLSFGGVLGIGERYHPIPWDVLTYDTELGGYNVDRSEAQLKGAPHYSREELGTLDYDRAGPGIASYYGVPL